MKILCLSDSGIVNMVLEVDMKVSSIEGPNSIVHAFLCCLLTFYYQN